MKEKKEIGFFDYKTQVWGLIRRVTALEDKGQHPIYDRLIETIARVEAIEQDLKGNKSSGYTHDRLYRNDPVDWGKQVEPEKPKEELVSLIRQSILIRRMYQENIFDLPDFVFIKLAQSIRNLVIEKVKEVYVYAEHNAHANKLTLKECVIRKLEEM